MADMLVSVEERPGLYFLTRPMKITVSDPWQYGRMSILGQSTAASVCLFDSAEPKETAKRIHDVVHPVVARNLADVMEDGVLLRQLP